MPRLSCVHSSGACGGKGNRLTPKSRRASGCAVALALWTGLAAAPAVGAGAVAGNGWIDPCRSHDGARSAAIRELYAQRDRAPIWLTRAGRTPAGRRLIDLLAGADGQVVTDCLAEALADPGGRYSRGALDVMLTDAYLALAERRSSGEAGVGEELAPLAPGQGASLRRRLEALADGGGAAHAGTEGDPIARMATALQRYRAIAERGGWPRVGEGPVLAPGSADPRVPDLRARLAATGDLAGERADDSKRHDGALVRALRRFQRRHGLEPDGVLGPATRAALDVSARRRVEQLEVNRRRLAARAIDERGPVVRVNIPAFRVTLREQGRVTFSSRAIVGRPEHPTPPLSTRLTGLTLNPAWNVPRTIVREKLAERFARDPGYAERRGFHAANSDRDLAEFDWDEQPMVPVRQAPGPANALGRIKFEMPNRQAIYLHDTPQTHLFDERRRAFSAGCVRVERPMALAARLTGIDRERLEGMARSGETRTLRLGWRVPVQLVYFTAWVDADGRVQFRADIYGRDERARGRTG